ncbi:MAG: peptidase T [Thermotogae bacterium]|nr:peptidase T [Thermotogota bacterium]
MKDVITRFIEYTKFYTTSDEESQTCPSSERQLRLANYIADELKEIGFENTDIDKNGYVTAELSANTDKKIPVVGFIAHMDTSPEITGENVKAKIIKYTGGDIKLSEEYSIKENEFPEIKNYKNQEIIITDGNTLLGADDKAGIAEIITALEYIKNTPEIKHGKIKIGFTPDEEIGRGADLFDVEKFGADFAYTIDGGPIGELEYENFNAASAKFKIRGKSVHPGTAKNKMVNASLIAAQLISMFPESQTPQNTEEYEGFFHVVSLKGSIEEAEVVMIIRDHDKKSFEDKKWLCRKNTEILNKKYGHYIEAEIKDSYYNMKEIIEKNMEIVETAKKAMEKAGVKPLIKAIRGGTDGARLSFMGLPCPNIFTGGHNFHGRYEYLPVESAKKAVDVIVQIVKEISDN